MKTVIKPVFYCDFCNKRGNLFMFWCRECSDYLGGSSKTIEGVNKLLKNRANKLRRRK